MEFVILSWIPYLTIEGKLHRAMDYSLTFNRTCHSAQHSVKAVGRHMNPRGKPFWRCRLFLDRSRPGQVLLLRSRLAFCYVWHDPPVPLRLPKLTDLRADPFERTHI